MNKLTALIKKSLASKTLFADVFAYSLIKTGYANKYLAGQISMFKSYSYIKRRFKKYIGDYEQKKPEKSDKKFVWVCWLQGIENAPDIVKSCYKSIKLWAKDYEVVLITKDNMSDYIQLPDYITEKWKKGIITNTHLSDIIRLELLIKYGGIWADATTYLTGPIPDYITESELFVFRNGWLDMEMINMGNWFICASHTNNVLLCETQSLIYKYWKKYNYIKNYFFMHMFFKMATEAHPLEWEKVPYYNQVDCHLIMDTLNSAFDQKRYDDICRLTSIHKLTYKTDGCKSDNKSKTFYDVICGK